MQMQNMHLRFITTHFLNERLNILKNGEGGGELFLRISNKTGKAVEPNGYI